MSKLDSKYSPNIPELTIVVPVYNRARLVERTLQSIARQTLRPLAVVLVDNNSTDNSLEVLNRWAQQHNATDFEVTVTSQTVQGAAAARNKGLELVSTPYLMFFDSDDTMAPSLCSDYLQKFRENPDAQIVYTGAMFHELNGTERKSKMCRHGLLRMHIYHSLLRTVGYAVRTDYFRSVGAWDEKMLGWDDWELGIRLLSANPKIVYMSGYPVDVYLQEESITGTDFASRPRFWEDALDKTDKVIENSPRRDKSSLHRLIDYRRIVLAAHYHREGNFAEAQRLYSEVMTDKPQCMRMKLLMPIVYAYVRRGLRGAAIFIDPLI